MLVHCQLFHCVFVRMATAKMAELDSTSRLRTVVKWTYMTWTDATVRYINFVLLARSRTVYGWQQNTNSIIYLLTHSRWVGWGWHSLEPWLDTQPANQVHVLTTAKPFHAGVWMALNPLSNNYFILVFWSRGHWFYITSSPDLTKGPLFILANKSQTVGC